MTVGELRALLIAFEDDAPIVLRDTTTGQDLAFSRLDVDMTLSVVVFEGVSID